MNPIEFLLWACDAMNRFVSMENKHSQFDCFNLCILLVLCIPFLIITLWVFSLSPQNLMGFKSMPSIYSNIYPAMKRIPNILISSWLQHKNGALISDIDLVCDFFTLTQISSSLLITWQSYNLGKLSEGWMELSQINWETSLK